MKKLFLLLLILVAAGQFPIQDTDCRIALLGGIVALRGGVTGGGMNPEWLHCGASSGSAVHRLPLARRFA